MEVDRPAVRNGPEEEILDKADEEYQIAVPLNQIYGGLPLLLNGRSRGNRSNGQSASYLPSIQDESAGSVEKVEGE